ncbi:(2Fe-2S)-binding protein [Duganella sp. BuS-21]|uniref:(2Fe-2S)-binding protein n=1 Tax=Duganella sp. BuS-21 TaxID=2943848 RepID=UPI0035A71345
MKLKINGKQHQLDVDPAMPLLWALRDEVGLTGSKFGCGMGLCGACTVHVDGQPVRSCVTPVGGLAKARITTIEGVAGKVALALRAAWVQHQVAQCGYCQSGQLMSAQALLQATPAPTDAQIDDAMSGNICRCATYARIRAAIHSAAAALKGKA